MTPPRAKDVTYIEELHLPAVVDGDEVSESGDGAAPTAEGGGGGEESCDSASSSPGGGDMAATTAQTAASDSAGASSEGSRCAEDVSGIVGVEHDAGGDGAGGVGDDGPLDGTDDRSEVADGGEPRVAAATEWGADTEEAALASGGPDPSEAEPSLRAHSDTLPISSSPTSIPGSTSFSPRSNGHSHRPPLRVLFLSSDTGGGHRASAESLAAQFVALYPGTTYKLMDVVSECGTHPFNGLVGWYSHLSKNPAQWKLVYRVSNSRAFQAAADVHLRVLTERAIRQKIAHAFVGEGASAPDVVVSVHPLMCAVPAAACANLSHDTGRHVPFFTVVTDLASAHSMWFDRNVEKMFLASEQLREVALERGGVEPEKIVMTGLPIRRDFAVQAEAMGPEGRDGADGMIYRKRVRDGLGLFPGSPSAGSSLCPSGGSKAHRVLLVMGGGEGCGALGPIVDALYVELVRRNVESTVVVVCGRNEALRQTLAERDWHGVMKRAFEDDESSRNGDDEGDGSGEEGLGRRAEIARRLRRIMSSPGHMEQGMLDAAAGLEGEEKKNEDAPHSGSEAEDESPAAAAARKRTHSWGLRQVLHRDGEREAAPPKDVGGADNEGSASSLGPSFDAEWDDATDPDNEEWMGYRVSAARRLRRAQRALQNRSATSAQISQNSQASSRPKDERDGASAPEREEEEGVEVERSEVSDTAESTPEDGVEVQVEAKQSRDEGQDTAAAGTVPNGAEETDAADGGEDSDAPDATQSEAEAEASEAADNSEDGAANSSSSEKAAAATLPRSDGNDVKDEGGSTDDVSDEAAQPDGDGPIGADNKRASSPGDEQARGTSPSDGSNGGEAVAEGEANQESVGGGDATVAIPRPKPAFRDVPPPPHTPSSTAHVTVHPLGFITRMAEYMVASDLLISKAGPGTIAEAASVGLPVLLTSFLPGQEEGNVDFVTERGFGSFVPDSDPRGVAREAASWLSDGERLADLGKKAREAGCPGAAEDIARQIGRSAARWKEVNEENAHAYAHARQVLRLGSDLTPIQVGDQDSDGAEGKDDDEDAAEEDDATEKARTTLRDVIGSSKEQALGMEPSVASDVTLTSVGYP